MTGTPAIAAPLASVAVAVTVTFAPIDTGAVGPVTVSRANGPTALGRHPAGSHTEFVVIAVPVTFRPTTPPRTSNPAGTDTSASDATIVPSHALNTPICTDVAVANDHNSRERNVTSALEVPSTVATPPRTTFITVRGPDVYALPVTDTTEVEPAGVLNSTTTAAFKSVAAIENMFNDGSVPVKRIVRGDVEVTDQLPDGGLEPHATAREPISAMNPAASTDAAARVTDPAATRPDPDREPAKVTAPFGTTTAVAARFPPAITSTRDTERARPVPTLTPDSDTFPPAKIRPPTEPTDHDADEPAITLN